MAINDITNSMPNIDKNNKHQTADKIDVIDHVMSSCVQINTSTLKLLSTL